MDSDLDVMINDSLIVANKLSSKNFKLNVYSIDIRKNIFMEDVNKCIYFKTSERDLEIVKDVSNLLIKSIIRVMSTVQFGESSNVIEENHSFNSLIYEIDLSINNFCLNTTVEIDYEKLYILKNAVAARISDRLSSISGNKNLVIKPISDFIYEDLMHSSTRDNFYYLTARNIDNISLISFCQKD